MPRESIHPLDLRGRRTVMEPLCRIGVRNSIDAPQYHALQTWRHIAVNLPQASKGLFEASPPAPRCPMPHPGYPRPTAPGTPVDNDPAPLFEP
ncbi:MAG: hypothetical protein RL722_778 [Pseudomonadota bacterium]|jgi:hypothetical protein